MKNNELTKKIIFFKIQNKTYGILLSAVREIIEANSISEVPIMPSSFAGLINLRGKIVSTYFLSKLLKRNSKLEKLIDHTKTCAVIIEVNKNLLGLIVDEVCEVLHVKNSEIQIIERIEQNQDLEFIQGLYKEGNEGLVPILDIEKVINFTTSFAQVS